MPHNTMFDLLDPKTHLASVNAQIDPVVLAMMSNPYGSVMGDAEGDSRAFNLMASLFTDKSRPQIPGQMDGQISMGDIAGQVKANPLGFTDPTQEVNADNQRLDAVMAGLQNSIAMSKKKVKPNIGDIAHMLSALIAGGYALGSPDEVATASGFETAGGQIDIAKRNMALRQAAQGGDIKQEMEMAKLYQDIISGQRGSAISASEQGNLAKSRTANVFGDVVTKNIDVQKFNLDVAKADQDRLSTLLKLSEQGQTVSKAKEDAALMKFGQQTMEHFRGEDGAVDIVGYFKMLDKIRPDISGRLAKLMNVDFTDTTPTLKKEIDTELKGLMVKNPAVEGITAGMPGFIDPEDMSTFVGIDNPKYNEVKKYWYNEAAKTVAERHIGEGGEPYRVGPATEKDMTAHERHAAKVAAAEARRAAAKNSSATFLEEMVRKYGPSGSNT